MSIFDCYGQERAIRTLQQARNARRIPHSYIFYGPEGVGKKLLAVQWAKLILCANPVQRSVAGHCDDDSSQNISTQTTNDCCDVCHECHLVETDAHPDLHIITRSLGNFVGTGSKSKITNSSLSESPYSDDNNKRMDSIKRPKKTTKARKSKALLYLPIDVIREFVIEPAGMYPVRHRAKIFIILDAHTMNRAAQNALLKTLEEPPDKTFIILVTSKPDLLLPTVHSRCQSIRFNTLTREYIYQQLLQYNISDNQAAYWAEFCQGQLGQALKLAAMDIFEWTNQLAEKLALLDYDNALQFAQWLIEKSQLYGGMLTENSKELTPASATRQGYLYMLDTIAHILNSALRLSSKSQPVRQVNTTTNNPGSFIVRIANRFGPFGCCKAIEDIQQYEKLLAANVNPSLIFESLLLKYIPDMYNSQSCAI